MGAYDDHPLGLLLKSLQSVNKLQPAIDQYTSRLSESIRLIVKTCLMEYLTDHVTTQGLEVERSASSEELEILFARRVKLICNENILTVPLKYYDVTVAVLMVSRV